MKLYYRLPSIDNEGKIQLNKFKLNMNEDLIVIWNTFYRYETKRQIEMDVKIVRLTKDILKMLKRPQPSLDNEMQC